MKVFADDNLSTNQKLNFVSGRIENIMGKEENAGYLSQNVFKRLLFQSWDCVVKG